MFRRHLAGDHWWESDINMPNSAETWKMFKKVINDENKFKIIPWLYAKEELFHSNSTETL
jgi:hypothetical protein